MALFERKYLPHYFLVLSVVAVYAQTLGFGFIQLDDPKHIFENPIMLRPRLAGLAEIWSAPYFGLYIPITYSFWWLISAISHSAELFHFFNLVLHALNAVLCFRLLVEILKRDYPTHYLFPALVGAWFFALHPLQTQAVTWISTAKDLLSGFFALCSLWSWSRQVDETHWRRSGTLAGIFYALSFLSKPSSALLPLVAWFLFPSGAKLKARNRLALSIGFILVLPLMILTKIQQPDAEVQIVVDSFSRIFVFADALGFYLVKILAPFPLVLDYGRDPAKVAALGLGGPYFWLGLALLAGLAWGLWRNRVFAREGLAILAVLLPVLGLIPFQFQVFSTVADHYLYLAMALVGLLVARSLAALYRPRLWSGVTLAGLVLATVTWTQVAHWQNDETLFTHNLRWNSASFLAHNNLGFYLYFTRRPGEAVPHFAETVRLRPTVPELKRNLAGALAASGRSAEAEQVLSN